MNLHEVIHEYLWRYTVSPAQADQFLIDAGVVKSLWKHIKGCIPLVHLQTPNGDIACDGEPEGQVARRIVDVSRGFLVDQDASKVTCSECLLTVKLERT